MFWLEYVQIMNAVLNSLLNAVILGGRGKRRMGAISSQGLKILLYWEVCTSPALKHVRILFSKGKKRNWPNGRRVSN